MSNGKFSETALTPFLCTAFQDMVRRGEIIDDDMEDEFYLRRLDAGLFVLQLISYIMAEICNANVPQVKLCTELVDRRVSNCDTNKTNPCKYCNGCMI